MISTPNSALSRETEKERWKGGRSGGSGGGGSGSSARSEKDEMIARINELG